MQTRVKITVVPEDVQRAAKSARRSFTAASTQLIVEEAGARTALGTVAKPRGFMPDTGVWQERWASLQC